MIVRGDARRIPLRDRTVQCVVTSPPYFQLRDYQCGPRQIGLEATPEQYVAALVAVFREVRRVLRDDGVLWLVLGDSYNAAGRNGHGSRIGCKQSTNRASAASADSTRPNAPSLKRKDLIGIPWRVALALQEDGWHLRADVIWAKPNPMPEPVRDRPTRSHEYVFLLTKRSRYFYDAGAISEPAVSDHPSANLLRRRPGPVWGNRGNATFWNDIGGRRNRRDVWNIPSEPTPEVHYAAFPTALARLCILAGSRCGDLVLDPFLGAGATGAAAERLGRRWVGIELSAEYVALARRRTAQAGLPFSSGPRSGPLSGPRSGRSGICFGCSPGGRSLWGKPGLGGFEPARGEAPIEAAALGAVKEL
jgi:DNA modification methylase